MSPPRTDLDGRVTNERGDPVRKRQADSGGGGWWFKVRRAPGPDGVELVTRYPRQDEVVTRHDTQAGADAAARAAYEQLQADTRSALIR